ncbi:DUF1722 domain-containing protein [Marinomonas agarivorans]|nr:DUF1722 domain-containing protein [Marinomonas agarivorans]
MTPQNTDGQTTETSERRISVGISSCLLGDNVRFNGGHSHSSYCTKTLSQYFQFEKFCPEVAAGFSTPRPTLRLIGDPNAPKMVYTKDSDTDVTETFVEGYREHLTTLDHLDGYIVMKNSPSCGMERIKIYQENGHPHMQRTAGLFTQALMDKYPLLPVEEDGRLNDPALRENFILRVFAHHEFRHQVATSDNFHDLLQFHSRYKYLVMAHSQSAYKNIGRLLSNAKKQPLHTLKEIYFAELMQAFKQPASRKNHCNVLMHLLGYLKRSVSGGIRQDIESVIHQYRRGEVTLITPVTLLRHYLNQYGSEYVKSQRYFEPYPAALGIRSNL